VFSRRIPADLTPSALARARATLGVPRFDLTASNPTLCDIAYPRDLLAPLSDPRGLQYRPEPLGLPEARAAVAAESARRGRSVDPARVVLASSTSEAYALLFKLVADSGDAVVLPAPSYPLLEHLAELEALERRRYRLERDLGWQPAAAALDLAGARALVSVHPNNPTGSLLEPATAAAVEARCATHGAAWIVDEVFVDFPLGETGTVASAAGGSGRALTFTLGGLSKYLGLPQLKLSWIVVGGPEPLAAEALDRLSFIADQYLSVGTPVQLALPRLFAGAAPAREAILARCRANLATLRAAAAGVAGVELVPPGAGWSAVLRYPHVVDEEALALELLREDGVAVHPGFLFDFAEPGYLVLSLLPPAATFEEGVARTLARLARRL
jgi:aspartate/methionine/tyrosine aminotransferase